jgi:hypothetical protein
MGLIVSLIYYWSRKNPDVEMSLMFGIRFKSIYFPWVLCAMRSVLLFLAAHTMNHGAHRRHMSRSRNRSLLMGGSPLAELCGIVAGHFYFFFEDIIPRTKGYRLLQTPAFMYVSILICPQSPIWSLTSHHCLLRRRLLPLRLSLALRIGRYRLIPPEYNSYNRGAQQQATRGPTFTGTGYTLRG